MTIRDVVIEGLTARVPKAEFDAACRPPYPTPEVQIAPRDRILRELTDRLPPDPDDDGPLTITRILGPKRPYRREVDLFDRTGLFSFDDAACALVAVGALDDADVDVLEPLVRESCAIRRQQVLNRLAEEDFDAARAAADRIGDGRSWTGHRDVAAVLAGRGDAMGFFAGWKRYAAGQDRAGMAELKVDLVDGVARAAGWQAALAVTRDKRIGPDYAWLAFRASGADVAGLLQVFAGEAAGVLSEVDELRVLAEAVREASGRNPEHDHPLLGGIVDRVVALDPATDRETMRTRDFLLFSLWPAIGEQATLARVRKAVRTPSYKRELTVLPRDLTRG